MPGLFAKALATADIGGLIANVALPGGVGGAATAEPEPIAEEPLPDEARQEPKAEEPTDVNIVNLFEDEEY